jgi:hypothetical protein
MTRPTIPEPRTTIFFTESPREVSLVNYYSSGEARFQSP